MNDIENNVEETAITVAAMSVGAVVIWALGYTMGKLFAKKHENETRNEIEEAVEKLANTPIMTKAKKKRSNQFEDEV